MLENIAQTQRLTDRFSASERCAERETFDDPLEPTLAFRPMFPAWPLDWRQAFAPLFKFVIETNEPDSCDCHNMFGDKWKRSEPWKPGDVRGIIEVTRKLER